MDEHTQKMLMAHAYKKQQELAALAADDNDACAERFAYTSDG